MSDTTISNEQVEEAPNERRALLRKLALGGAGAAIAATALGKTAEAASTVNGEPITAGNVNLSTGPTVLIMDPASAAGDAAPSSFSVSNAAPGLATAPFPANVGGYGNAKVVHGVHGSTTVPGGFGVVVANLAPSPATGNTTDPVPTALALASVGGAHARFVQQPGAVTGPTPGKHLASELYVDKDGTLWFTVPTATAGVVRFVKLAGTPTAGSYTAINPQRAYDSRQPNYAVRGVLAPNTSRVISVADGHSENGTAPDALKNVVPAGATAVQINVTAANMTGPNFLSVTAGDVTSTTTSLLNWDAGVKQIANSITVPVNDKREIRVFNGNQTGSTDVIIDVFGFYL